MINLLPKERKKTIRAGLANRLLIRYLVLSIVTLGAVLLIFILAWIYLLNVKAGAEQTIADAQAASRSISADAAKVTVFENNLKTAKQILDREINYSQIVLRYAAAIPPNTIIDSITLDPSIAGKTSDFTAKVKSEQDVTKLKDALTSSEYFDNVRFLEVVLIDSDGEYKYNVSIELTVNEALLDNSEDDS